MNLVGFFGSPFLSEALSSTMLYSSARQCRMLRSSGADRAREQVYSISRLQMHSASLSTARATNKCRPLTEPCFPFWVCRVRIQNPAQRSRPFRVMTWVSLDMRTVRVHAREKASSRVILVAGRKTARTLITSHLAVLCPSFIMITGIYTSRRVLFASTRALGVGSGDADLV